jgi:pilus assembly protein CpaF
LIPVRHANAVLLVAEPSYTDQVNVAHAIATLTEEQTFRIPEAAISMLDLVTSSLRMTPQWLVVGEVRGGEALTLLRAQMSGPRSTPAAPATPWRRSPC